MEDKYCPLLLAAGYKDARCSEGNCAWYVETEDGNGCALTVLAENKEEKQ